LTGKNISVLGLTFKPNTDDMREASSLVIVPELVRQGAHVKAYDPEGRKEASWRFEGIPNFEFCQDEWAAVKDADAVVILTEWNQFRNLDFNRLEESVRGKVLFDLRNIYNRKYVEELGFVYYGTGV